MKKTLEQVQTIEQITSNSLLSITDTIMKLYTEMSKYKKAYEILYCYYDSISDEEKPKVAKQLDELKL